MQEQPSPEEVLALAKLLSAAQKGLMGAALDPTMCALVSLLCMFVWLTRRRYISKPVATTTGLSPELTLLRDRAVDSWDELTSRAAMRAKGARAGIDADLNALHSVLKVLIVSFNSLA